ncbi:MAG TPA: acetylornithine/succinylornithine family transaminase [Longimicrobiales bacterium]|nr:acetylornithine/succinylornithine family transaminase [Longimicrobiales bacterium]
MEVIMTDALVGTYKTDRPLLVSARGCRVTTEDGRELLDFVSGIGVNALGYQHPVIMEAMQAGLTSGLVHASNLYRNQPAQKLARLLTEVSFADKVFFCNSGGEANEAAFKFARRYARERVNGDKHEIVALKGSFHGRLFGTLAATDRPSFRAPFEPLMPGVRFVVPGDFAGASAAVSHERTAAIIAEPIQGEGGIRPLEAKFLAHLRALADAHDAVLIFDEVQCGLGRTGTLFAYEHFGVVPDILTLAKPLAGGLPMGAVLVSEKIAATIKPGDHATTFGGGALVSTVAHAVVQHIADRAFLASVRTKGDMLAAALGRLTALPKVKEVRGIGLMWGIELNELAAPFVSRLYDAGLLVTSAGENVIRLLPPLVVSERDIASAVQMITEVLQ